MITPHLIHWSTKGVHQRIAFALLGITTIAAPSVSMAVSPAEAKLAAATLKSSAPMAPPSVEFLGMTEFAGDALDGSGLDAKLEDQSPSNRLGGFSAMEFTGEGDRFVLLSDRGAGDGAVSFPCRMHSMDLRISSDGGITQSRSIESQLIGTTLLTACDSSQLDGSSATSLVDRSQSDGETWHAMDPEGIRRWQGGFLISDEYGPHLGTFNVSGRMTSEWKLPESRGYGVYPSDPNSNEKAVGCFDNKGLEGLAVTPSTNTVWASYQSSLLQDGEFDGEKCRGDLVRWLAFDADGQRVREVAYPLDHRKSGISEILAVDEERLLVLERDSKGGDEAKIKRIILADLRGASDVSSIESLPTNQESLRDGFLGDGTSVRLVKKQLLINLMEWQDELGDAATAEKPEGLAWGRPLEDGRRTLWICWDNDFDPARKSYVACFAVAID